MVTNIRRVLNLANKEIKKNEPPTLYKRNAGFIAKLHISPRNKILDKLKNTSSKTRTTLILDRCTQAKKLELQLKTKQKSLPHKQHIYFSHFSSQCLKNKRAVFPTTKIAFQINLIIFDHNKSSLNLVK